MHSLARRLAGIVAVFVALVFSSAAGAQSFALRAARLWDGVGVAPIAPGVVLVEDGRVVAAGADVPYAERCLSLRSGCADGNVSGSLTATLYRIG